MPNCKTCENGTLCTTCKDDHLLLPHCKNSKNGYFTVENPVGTFIDQCK